MDFMHDTRDKAGKHDNVEKYLISHGHRFVRSKCFVGDITLIKYQGTSIDLKRDLQEVIGDFLTKPGQGERFNFFTKECIKAQEFDIRLIFLVEHGGAIRSIEDVKNWVNPRLKESPYAVSGQRLYKMMRTYSDRYGVEWRFCDKRCTGRVICELLGGE